jgi:hypothetical protein
MAHSRLRCLFYPLHTDSLDLNYCYHNTSHFCHFLHSYQKDKRLDDGDGEIQTEKEKIMPRQPWLVSSSLTTFGVGGVLVGWASGGFNGPSGFKGAIIGGIVGSIAAAILWAANLFLENRKKDEKA